MNARNGWERRRSILLNEYERVALELFAARGYHEVTVDDIAEASGVTTRTLFRYFPSKQDFLLGFPRRGLAAEVELIDALEPTEDPLGAGWDWLQAFVTGNPVEVGVVDLWKAAAEGAPEVTARVRGERTDGIFQAFVRFGERSWGVDQARDPRPRWLGGVLSGFEVALVESVAQAPEVVEDLLAACADSVYSLGAKRLRKQPARPKLSATD